MPEPKTFQVTTSGSWERTYTVQAKDEDHARKRMRAFINDPDMVGEGLVVEDTDAARYVSGEQIKAVAAGGPAVKAVPPAAQAS